MKVNQDKNINNYVEENQIVTWRTKLTCGMERISLHTRGLHLDGKGQDYSDIIWPGLLLETLILEFQS